VLILLCAFLAAGCVLIARLGQMQIAWHGDEAASYRSGVAGNRLLDAPRGTICTSEGVVLARDVPAFDLSIHYRRLREDTWQEAVSRLSGVSVEELNRRAAEITERVERIWRAVRQRSELPDLRIVEQEQFHAIVEDIPPEVAVRVRTMAAEFPDLKVTHRIRRAYFNGSLAPHVVGRCRTMWPERLRQLMAEGRVWTAAMPVSEIGDRYCRDDRVGESGIERSYEDVLCGRRGYVEHYLLFHPLSVERRAATVFPQPGHDVYLTLREPFQRAANDALEWAARNPELSFTKGALVIMDARSGAVLAAATYPSYNLETFQEDFESLLSDPRKPLLFRPTRAALPTGSIYKVMTAVAALEEGKITPSTTFHCAGGVRFRRRWFHCTGTHGAVGLVRAIEVSCNAYFFQTAALLDGAAMARWGRAFGLGVPTGADLPFETVGQVPEPRSLFGRLNLAIGQGEMLCTPLQVARMCAAVANGGTLVQPHFVDRVVDADGNVVRWVDPQIRTIGVRAETLRLVREGMHNVVVGPRGTARRAGLARFDAAGKTGTAELGPGRPNHAWFAGFAPFEDPKIAFAVVSERCPGHGGSHAAPIMARALEAVWAEVERMP